MVQWSISDIGGGNALISLRSAVKLEEEERVAFWETISHAVFSDAYIKFQQM